MAACCGGGGEGTRSACDVSSWCGCLIVGLVFSHLGFWSGNIFSDCAFS